MRKVLSRSLLTAAATTGVLAGVAGYAQADSQADSGAVGSPGVLSGNSVQAPVHLPANVCGNSVSVIGLLNPTFGNGCGNHSVQHAPEHQGGHHKGTEEPPEKAAPRPAEKPAEAPEHAPERSQPVDEPEAQSPARPEAEHAPAAQPAQERASEPVREAEPDSPEQAGKTDTAGEVLAETGSSGTGMAAVAGLGALLGGVVLYRRSAARRS